MQAIVSFCYKVVLLHKAFSLSSDTNKTRHLADNVTQDHNM